MSMHSVMNRSILRVGYVSFYIPNLFYDDVLSTLTGIYADIWNDYGRIARKEIVFIKKDAYDTIREVFPPFIHFFLGGYLPEKETGLYAGMLGDVQSGRLDGIVDAYSSQSQRIPYFRVTREVDYTTESFFEADTISLWPYLTQYFIFDGLSYLFITKLLMMFSLIFLMFKLKKLKISFGMTNAFYLIFVTFLVAFFNAEISAITIVPTFNISTSCELSSSFMESKWFLSNFCTLIDELHNGKRRLITTNGQYLRVEHNRELFGVENPGSGQLVIQPHVQTLFNELCADPRLVYYDADSIMMSASRSKYPVAIRCPLRKIDTTDRSSFPVDSAVSRKKFGEQKTYVFYLSKEGFNRTEYEKFVGLQLKLYRYEKISGIHLRRYISKGGSSNRDQLPDNRVTFSFVAPLSIVLAFAHSVSLLVFGIECALARFRTQSHKIIRAW